MAEPTITIPARTALQIMKELRVMSDSAVLRGNDGVARMIALRSEWWTRCLSSQLTKRELEVAMVANTIEVASVRHQDGE
ncbi:MAG: hypothetical protein CVV05_00110 [Gammaproteobacteria bacterium HGW-Gammaproteobacteria-1]|jgi:hypothetical protein|nr:MAG: hypothetical protein CVV05_00110 [Gammaproteobacteria bacterium HGW-Gammaproteobacteria-1]